MDAVWKSGVFCIFLHWIRHFGVEMLHDVGDRWCFFQGPVKLYGVMLLLVSYS